MTSSTTSIIPSEAAKAKACELFEAGCREIGVDAKWLPDDFDRFGNVRAFARFIQQVSDAAKAIHKDPSGWDKRLAPFILPDPVDPLEAVCADVFDNGHIFYATRIAEALAKRGLQIVPVQP